MQTLRGPTLIFFIILELINELQIPVNANYFYSREECSGIIEFTLNKPNSECVDIRNLDRVIFEKFLCVCVCAHARGRVCVYRSSNENYIFF